MMNLAPNKASSRSWITREAEVVAVESYLGSNLELKRSRHLYWVKSLDKFDQTYRYFYLPANFLFSKVASDTMPSGFNILGVNQQFLITDRNRIISISSDMAQKISGKRILYRECLTELRKLLEQAN